MRQSDDRLDTSAPQSGKRRGSRRLKNTSFWGRYCPGLEGLEERAAPTSLFSLTAPWLAGPPITPGLPGEKRDGSDESPPPKINPPPRFELHEPPQDQPGRTGDGSPPSTDYRTSAGDPVDFDNRNLSPHALFGGGTPDVVTRSLPSVAAVSASVFIGGLDVGPLSSGDATAPAGTSASALLAAAADDSDDPAAAVAYARQMSHDSASLPLPTATAAARGRAGRVASVATTTAEPESVTKAVRKFVVQLKPGHEHRIANFDAWLKRYRARATPTKMAGLYEIEAGGRDLRPLYNSLGSHRLVQYVDVPKKLTLADTLPNDPSYSSLWGLNGTYGVKAPQAWDYTTGSTSVVVAVIDTGIDINHPDLYLNIWVNQGEIPTAIRNNLTDIDGDGLITFWDLNNSVNQGSGKAVDVNGDGRISASDILAPMSGGGWANGVSDNGDAYVDDLVGWDWVNNDNNPSDDNSHGTHCAGTIGAVGNNGVGVVGVNWKVQLMALKVLNASGSGSTTNGGLAIRYAADNGAKLSSNSWAGSSSGTLSSAITYAAGRNHIVVAAAGNSGQNLDTNPVYPAAYSQDNIVSVASIGSGGNISGFSNYSATKVDVGAPGESILSTIPGTGYGYKSGTSMATPHVSGVLALVMAQNPTWSYTQVINRVYETVTPLSSLAGKTVTGGLVNAAAAAATGPEVRVLDDTADVFDGTSTVTMSTMTGSPVTKTFTVRNVGTATLTVGPTITVPAGFTLVSGFGSTSLAPGASTTFTVRLDAASAGTYSGQVAFATNDPDENPFNFTLTGTVSNVVIIDNGDAGFATSGNWSPWLNEGYQNDIHYSAAGSGADSATWTFAVTPGQYRVSVTWHPLQNRATNSPFTVLDGSTALGTVRLNQEVRPNDFMAAGVWWTDLGTFTISGSSLVVRLTDDANEYVIADAVRIERVA